MTPYQQVRSLNNRFNKELDVDGSKNEIPENWLAIYEKYALEFEDILYNLLDKAKDSGRSIEIDTFGGLEVNGILNRYKYSIPYNNTYIYFYINSCSIEFRSDNSVYANRNMSLMLMCEGMCELNAFKVTNILNINGIDKSVTVANDLVKRLCERIEKNIELHAWLLLQNINLNDMFLLDCANTPKEYIWNYTKLIDLK